MRASFARAVEARTRRRARVPSTSCPLDTRRATPTRAVERRTVAVDDDVPAPPSCKRCKDTGARECRDCKGRGYLPPGGYHSKNVVDAKTAVGSRWTAHRRTRGWRHFECVAFSPKAKTATLRATCDTSVTVDVPIAFLKDRMEWSAGWKQREDLDWIGDFDKPGGAVARPKGGASCSKCRGLGTVPCDAEGCEFGVVRIEKQRAVIEKTEKIFKRQLESLRDVEGDAAKERRTVLKKQLKTKSQMKKERAKAESERKKNEKTSSSDVGGWSDFRNSQRDEILEAWLAGATDRRDEPDNQQ